MACPEKQRDSTELALRGGFVAEIGTVVNATIPVPKTLGQERRWCFRVVGPNW